ncbi:MAG: zinc ABC transporter substrate-binding protein [Deltaproteobacteria bacterium]|nr:MAG: zinc ABC transporter substrate-binding protein [Deltaproteobacteria bacterium]
MEIPEGKIDRTQGDIHPLGNPHVWLDPRRVKVIAQIIKEGLVKNDAAGQDVHEKNLASYQQKLDQKINEWQTRAKTLRSVPVVTYHKSFSYLSDWLGFQVVDYLEPKPGIPPSPGHILSLIDMMKSKHVSLILSENYYNPVPAQELGQKTGAKVLILDTEGGDKDYISVMDTIIGKLDGRLVP